MHSLQLVLLGFNEQCPEHAGIYRWRVYSRSNKVTLAAISEYVTKKNLVADHIEVQRVFYCKQGSN